MENKPERLYLLAQRIVEHIPDFFEIKGQGPGDHATLNFMKNLRYVAKRTFGQDFSERNFRESVDYRFDFYFPDEATVVEVALGLYNPQSEYERDLFKCILALESGLEIKRLVFISKPGAKDRQGAPGPRAIAEWVNEQFDVEIEILELQPPERG